MEKLGILIFGFIVFVIGLLFASGFVIGKFGLIGIVWLCGIVGAFWLLCCFVGFIFSLFGGNK